jgi:phage-related protein
MTFDEVTKQLATTFGGQATEQAETFSGKMERLGIAFDEAKETVGSFVLDAITPLITNFVDKGIPAIQDFADKIGNQLSPVFTDLFIFIREEALPALQRWYQFLVNVVIPAIIKTVTPVIQGIFSAFNKVKTAIDQNYESLKPLIDGFKAFVKFLVSDVLPIVGKGLGTAFSALGSIIAGLVKGFASVADAIGDVVSGVKSLINLVTGNPVVKGISNLISSAFGGGRAEGGSVKAGTSYVVGERGAEMFVPKTDGVIVPNNKLGGGGNVTNLNINVTGALDKEGVARQIVDILNNSFYRGTLAGGSILP